MVGEEISKKDRDGMNNLHLLHHHHLVVEIALEYFTRMNGKHLMASTHQKKTAAELDIVTKIMIEMEPGTEIGVETEVETGMKSAIGVETIRIVTSMSEAISVTIIQSDPKVETEAGVEVHLHFLVVKVDNQTNIQKVRKLNRAIQDIVALQIHLSNEIPRQ